MVNARARSKRSDLKAKALRIGRRPQELHRDTSLRYPVPHHRTLVGAAPGPKDDAVQPVRREGFMTGAAKNLPAEEAVLLFVRPRSPP